MCMSTYVPPSDGGKGNGGGGGGGGGGDTKIGFMKELGSLSNETSGWTSFPLKVILPSVENEVLCFS